MDIFAHRGASKAAPENTMASFQLALANDSDGVELDVHLSADGVPVVIHDNTLLRTAGIDAEVHTLSAADLTKCNANGRWKGLHTPIPTLDKVLQWGMHTPLLFNIELKSSPTNDAHAPEKVLESVFQYSLQKRCIVSSFSAELLTHVKKVDDAIETAWLPSGPVREWSAQANACRANGIHMNQRFANKRLVSRLRSEQLYVRVYTVNTALGTMLARRMGFDGVITDKPAMARAVMKRQS
ncbi:glycerophosphodiester phosphodiesterase [Aureibacillus halotolerans]|uniref:Glycerophosphoryl diester phosphodiesterase n=1 Tax=Aureibacillus halotolerans TaxID=1508390 RepID=A0A4R6U550_9BACI|nr:glycerophosphodiester phosphodiesterase family protein [Aureibacillus halotolerans]TDQ41620.1 glycerophosphoryl diester phosphodiesterase [Aureibacillus halotolerans]